MEHHLEDEARERARIEHELEVARDIQLGSLPEGVPTLEGWQIDPYCQPAREVGGDFYEFYQLGDGRVGFVVGDATGKGVPAAIVTTATAAYLGAVAAASDSSLGRHWLWPTKRCSPASPPTCSSPASTPSWSQRALA